jgi:23S rRNA G2069 N7-methylase RlmK/C1962 C5-methylase RlmI
MTSAYRLVHGAADGRPGWYVDRLGDFLLASASDTDPDALPAMGGELASRGTPGIYRRATERTVRGAAPAMVSPHRVWGEVARRNSRLSKAVCATA